MAHHNYSVALGKDPNYRKTVANTIRLLREILEHVVRGETNRAIGKIDFAIEHFEGQEHNSLILEK